MDPADEIGFGDDIVNAVNYTTMTNAVCLSGKLKEMSISKELWCLNGLNGDNMEMIEESAMIPIVYGPVVWLQQWNQEKDRLIQRSWITTVDWISSVRPPTWNQIWI